MPGCCPTLQDGNGLWYTQKWGEASWLRGWSLMATRYANSSFVIGAGLRNEPRPTIVGETLASTRVFCLHNSPLLAVGLGFEASQQLTQPHAAALFALSYLTLAILHWPPPHVPLQGPLPHPAPTSRATLAQLPSRFPRSSTPQAAACAYPPGASAAPPATSPLPTKRQPPSSSPSAPPT